jgi:hypothetical protein
LRSLGYSIDWRFLGRLSSQEELDPRKCNKIIIIIIIIIMRAWER